MQCYISSYMISRNGIMLLSHNAMQHKPLHDFTQWQNVAFTQCNAIQALTWFHAMAKCCFHTMQCNTSPYMISRNGKTVLSRNAMQHKTRCSTPQQILFSRKYPTLWCAANHSCTRFGCSVGNFHATFRHCMTITRCVALRDAVNQALVLLFSNNSDSTSSSSAAGAEYCTNSTQIILDGIYCINSTQSPPISYITDTLQRTIHKRHHQLVSQRWHQEHWHIISFHTTGQSQCWSLATSNLLHQPKSGKCWTWAVQFFRPHHSHSAAAYTDQTFCRSVRRSVQCIVEKWRIRSGCCLAS